MVKIILFLSLVLASSLVRADYDPTDDLLSAFGSNCSIYGDISAQAIAQTAALKSVFESIRDDPDCRGVSTALDKLSSSLSVDLLQQSSQEEKDYDNLRAYNADLELALQFEVSKGPAADPNYVLALQTELASSRIEQIRTRREPDTLRFRRRIETVRNFQLYSVQLFEALKANAKCTTKNPNVVAQIGAQILGLSGNFSSSGLVGSAFLATGVALEHFFDFLREYGISSSVQQLVSTRSTIAISCMLEGLARTFCQARDLQTVIEANRNIREETNLDPRWAGVDLISQDLLPFQRWIAQVTAGSPASSPAQASDKKSGADLENSLKKLTYDLQAVLATANLTIASDTRRSIDRRILLQETFENLANATRGAISQYSPMTNTVTSGPLYSLFLEDPSCGPLTYFYSEGKRRACPNKADPNESCITCVTRIDEYKFNELTEDQLEQKIKNASNTITALLRDGGSEVARKVALVKENNAQLILSEVMTEALSKRTTLGFLQNAKSYLERIRDHETTLYQIPLKGTVDKALGRVSTALYRILNPTADPQSDVLELAVTLAPMGDMFDFSREISLIVKQDIDQKLRQGEVSENLNAVMQLSSSDGLGQLLRTYVGLDTADAQASAAQGVSIESLDVAGEFFKEQIVETLERLSERAANNRNAQKNLALYCLRLLLVPKAIRWEHDELDKYCGGRTYTSIHSASGLELRFNNIRRLFTEGRVCSIYDFFRKSRLYELRPWNMKN